MKTEIRKYVAAALICLGMSSCSDFFESIPGKQFGLEETFASKQRTEQYLNNGGARRRQSNPEQRYRPNPAHDK